MNDKSPTVRAETQPLTEPSPVKVVSSEELFADCREICIDHAGVRYKLRITRRNKLILQK